MLSQSWPLFLNLLDDNPDEAFKGFYTFTQKLLKLKPPKGLRSLSETESQDVIQEIVLHCVRDDFRVLRQYKDRGKPFAAWLYMLAHNKCLDVHRKKNREADIVSSDSDPTGSNPGIFSADPDISPEQRTRLRSVIGGIRTCMSNMGQYCQLLLQLAADEYVPREMVQVLGLSKDRAKKVSDDLRECRKRLRKLAADQGIDLASAFEV